MRNLMFPFSPILSFLSSAMISCPAAAMVPPEPVAPIVTIVSAAEPSPVPSSQAAASAGGGFSEDAYQLVQKIVPLIRVTLSQWIGADPNYQGSDTISFVQSLSEIKTTDQFDQLIERQGQEARTLALAEKLGSLGLKVGHIQQLVQDLTPTR